MLMKIYILDHCGSRDDDDYNTDFVDDDEEDDGGGDKSCEV
jgi:hypothetical protein